MADPLLVRACRREPVERTPVWFMRQAGRSLPEYRAIRERHTLFEICRQPELCAEVTLQPVRRHGIDAAVMFADIMLPVLAMGIEVELVEGVGPVVAEPIASVADVERLRVPDPDEAVPEFLEAIRLVRAELEPERAVIGFAGSPFTVAGYLLEGRPSRDFARTKRCMYAAPKVWRSLMEKLAATFARYLTAQARAGVDAVQLFDSWAGALSVSDYREFVAPYSARILAAVDVPAIHFGTGTAHLLGDMAAAGGDVIGIDWRLPLDRAWEAVGLDRGVQGNLDPALLLGPWERVERGAGAILDAVGGRPGHVFNLGHGVLPDTDPGVLGRLAQLVHERTTGRAIGSEGDRGRVSDAPLVPSTPPWEGSQVHPPPAAKPSRGRRCGGAARVPIQCPLRANSDPGRADVEGRALSAAVVLMAYGSPARIEDVPAYLDEIRGGRPVSQRAVDELVDRYRHIGVSPLNEITERQRAGLERELGLPVFAGMKHWQPRIADAAAGAVATGATTIVGLVLAPHYSRLSIGGYRDRLEAALAGSDVELSLIESWHDHPPYLDVVASRIGGTDAHVVFTAHSLPARILAEGDPYRDQLLETARLAAERAGIPSERWSFAFQSESATGEPWLGPDILVHLEELHGRGVRKVLVAPIGFVADHLEILWDIDVEARERAAELGLELDRIASMNDDPAFVKALAGLVRRHLSVLSVR